MQNQLEKINGVITKYRNRKKYTEYKLVLTRDTEKWKIYKRYSDFHTLHKKLEERFPVESLKFTMPPKKVFGKMKEKVVSNRVSQFNTYLQQILSSETVRQSSLVLNFIGYCPRISGKWTKIQHKGDIPPPRTFSNIFIYEKLLYLFGGSSLKSESFNDLYSYDFEANIWKQEEIGGEAPDTKNNTIVFANGLIYLLGGFRGEIETESFSQNLNEFYILDIIKKQWSKIEAKGETITEQIQAAIYHKDKIFCFSYFVTPHPTIYILDLAENSVKKTETKNTCEATSLLNFIGVGENALIFGGKSLMTTENFGNLLILNLGELRFREIHPLNTFTDLARHSGSLTFVPKRISSLNSLNIEEENIQSLPENERNPTVKSPLVGGLIIMGGYQDSHQLHSFETFFWFDLSEQKFFKILNAKLQSNSNNLEDLNQEKYLNVPADRYGQSAIYHNNKIFLFGGGGVDEYHNKKFFNDLWVFQFD
ncbi:hypothetical protein M0811_14388 [Anaeramoeba ignava]|uniref:PX domain-containing protein n=1 Tax=Anaeramoeba ignava TaxID=1746090 RepID=A0A9Q0LYH2_ANAIG|nr:hypothetical protein M0811_14388 [Anaeramoeba ignava]